MVDVTVRHEDGPNLQKAAEEKVLKYQPILPQAARLHGMSGAKVLPVVVGISGGMPKQTISALKNAWDSGQE